MIKALRLLVCAAALSLPGPVLAGVYWGDLHVHTGYSADGDPSTTPDSACYYAKQNGLNFTSVTDHSEGDGFSGGMTQALWNDSVAKMQSGNCSPTANFLAFTGYEWTNGAYGHRSVIFKNLNIPWSAVFNATAYPSPSALWSALDAAGYQSTALTIPHHPAGTSPADINWDYHNANYQPVVEIYSEHGNSEFCATMYDPLTKGCTYTGAVDYALGVKGLKLGFTAGTDAHDAKAGSVNDPDGYRTEQSYGGGLMAVIAPSLTREDIWYAIKNKHTYATSGPKMPISFQINGFGMGSTAIVSAGTNPTLNITGSGIGSNIGRIEIIKNGVGGTPANVAYFNSPSVSYSWTDSNYASGDFYYVRVIQNNLERAWSSPIWVVTQ